MFIPNLKKGEEVKELLWNADFLESQTGRPTTDICLHRRVWDRLSEGEKETLKERFESIEIYLGEGRWMEVGKLDE